MTGDETVELQTRAFSGAQPVREFASVLVEHACSPNGESCVAALCRATPAWSPATETRLIGVGRNIAALHRPRVARLRVLKTTDREVLRVAAIIAGEDGALTLTLGAQFAGEHWHIVEIGKSECES